MKQTVTLELDIPEGYEATGEYRVVKDGEYYMGSLLGSEHHADHNGPGAGHMFHILRKLPSATVTVELPREVAEWAWGLWADESTPDLTRQRSIGDACRAALKNEESA